MNYAIFPQIVEGISRRVSLPYKFYSLPSPRVILLSYLTHIFVFIDHTQRPFKTTYETQSAQVYKMTSQAPSSLGTNVIKGQQDASTRTNDVVITSDMTPDDVINMVCLS